MCFGITEVYDKILDFGSKFWLYRVRRSRFATEANEAEPKHIRQNRKAILANVPAYAMFASGIIARSAYHWQIWAKACGGTEQVVAAYAVLADVFLFFSDDSRLF
jgi:hypothetical protein